MHYALCSCAVTDSPMAPCIAVMPKKEKLRQNTEADVNGEIL